jgi:Do/DeqQ family serine protease
VNVYVRRRIQSRISPFFNDPFFERFFGRDFGIPRERVQSSLGSGVIVSSDGVVVTNFHVIKGGEDSDIKVALADKREFPAHIILKDEQTDLAVLQIVGEGNSFPYIELADSDGLEVGDLVLAIGNPFGVGQTVTSGIVSALARTRVGISDYQFFIQTDAAINPGNSGGALVDMNGRLVGINTAIFSKSGGSLGIGFAIPSNMTRLVVQSALHGGKVQRPWFGAKLQSVTSDIAESIGLDRPSGALVARVHENGPAQQAGLRIGDVIVGIDGHKVPDPRAFNYHFSTQGLGKPSELDIVRDGRLLRVKIGRVAAPEIPARNTQTLKGPHPFDGAEVANLSPALAVELSIDDLSGVVVTNVNSRSSARSVGIKAGDIIVEINGQKVSSVRTLKRALARHAAAWKFSIKRNGRILSTIIRG